MIGIYAITDAPPATLPESEHLRAVSNAGLVAFCGPPQNGSITPDVLWRHEAMIETLMKTCDLLPVRFGTQVEDEHAAAMVLARQQRELKAALERVRGAVELSVRVVSGDRERRRVPVVASGADYLRSKAIAADDQARIATAVHDALAGGARASRRLRQVDGRDALCFAYLVERDGVTAFTRRVDDLRRSNPDLQVLCTGPWPPYSFVRE